jgi:hypothetical protein
MNLYLLVNSKAGYDENEAMAILANNERQARRIANAHRNHEGAIWEDKRRVTCKLVDTGVAGLVLISYNAG